MAVITDTFTRANGGLGANWTTTTSQVAPQINTNVVVPNAVGGTQSRAWYNATTIGADQYAQVAITALNQGSGNSFGGVDLRVASGAQTYYTCKIFGIPGGNVFAELLKCITGTETSLASSSSIPLAVNDVLKGTVIGTTITMYLNGAVILGPVTDTAIASGQPGLCVATNVGAVTDAQIDTWEAGDILPKFTVANSGTRPAAFKPGLAR